MAKANLHGRVVAVTGGARGIGLAIARALAEQGARVCIGDVDVELAAREAQALGAQSCRLDVRDRDAFAAFLLHTERTLGPLDVLINNAGIMPMGPFAEEAAAVTKAQLDINLLGVIHGMQLALPGMRARGRGHIVNVASLLGTIPLAGAATYCATKYGVVGLTESVRLEYRDSGLHFSLVLPSRVSTELSLGTGAGSGVPTASPDEVAAAVVHALRHRAEVVTAPRYMAPVPSLMALAPRWLESRVRRVLRDNRLITDLDRRSRAGYEQRIDALANGGEGV